MPPTSLHPRDLAPGDCQTLELIDVRTPSEFGEVHARDAVCVPLDSLDPKAVWTQRKQPGKPLYLLCRSGARARMAAERFIAAGLTDVVVIDGGTDAWAALGLPVVRGRKAMSLERQVRIAAGSLVVLGAGLGWLVHPGFFGLSAFVGAGLVFAGLTDTCALGMMLARLPWNRRVPIEACAASPAAATAASSAP
ncbi:MAG: rhodanese-like domain-containing protein [Planctomycetes bacterium]|nr:rhodanese-like domain-containing protein [Planctomycetota bacterium]